MYEEMSRSTLVQYLITPEVSTFVSHNEFYQEYMYSWFYLLSVLANCSAVLHLSACSVFSR